MKGNVFNIQKFSIHDGPGVRTTVFFKGCPLRCKWCSNPESQESDTQITYDPGLCTGCLTCLQVCPVGAIQLNTGVDDRKNHLTPDKSACNEKNRLILDKNACKGCQTCVSNCMVKAMKAEGEMKEVDEVVKICLQDMDFYEESGGGVTLSGGECLCQPEYVKELLGALHSHKIHVAAETTGHIKEDIFRELAPEFDLLLFDVKHYDPTEHKAGTGVDNALIIKNLTWAHETGLEILPRIPVIPGFNASLSQAEGIASLLASIGLKRVQLLPFHQFGERKYELLGREYACKDIKALYPEDLLDYKQVFLDKGLECFI